MMMMIVYYVCTIKNVRCWIAFCGPGDARGTYPGFFGFGDSSRLLSRDSAGTRISYFLSRTAEGVLEFIKVFWCGGLRC